MEDISSRELLENLTEEEVREMIKTKIAGERTRFPHNFWTCKRGKEFFIQTIKYLYEEQNQWTPEEILAKSSTNDLHELALYRPLQLHFDGSFEKAMEQIYPEIFLTVEGKKQRKLQHIKNKIAATKSKSEELTPEEIQTLTYERFAENKQFPLIFWQVEGKERFAEVTRYFVEEILQIAIEEIPEKASPRAFNDYRLGDVMYGFFNSYYELFDYVYPGTFQVEQFATWFEELPKNYAEQLTDEQVRIYAKLLFEHQLKKMPRNFWTAKKGKHYFKVIFQYLIQDHMKIPVVEIPKIFSQEFMNEYNLRYPIAIHFQSNWLEAINTTFKTQFKPEQFEQIKHLSRKRRELIEEEDVITIQEARTIIKQIHMGKIARYPRNFWYGPEGKERFKQAVQILLEEFLGWSKEGIPKRISFEIFRVNRLVRPLYQYFESYIDALDYVYPNTFRLIDYTNKPNKFWAGEKGMIRSKRAIQEMLEDLNFPIDEIPKKIRIKTFIEYGLVGMLEKNFARSPYQAIELVYPGRFKQWEYSPIGYWKKQSIDTAREAVRWLVEEKLQLSQEEIFTGKVAFDDFKDNGLYPLLKYFYNYSVIQALEDVVETPEIRAYVKKLDEEEEKNSNK
jgi:hypothetical protein